MEAWEPLERAATWRFVWQLCRTREDCREAFLGKDIKTSPEGGTNLDIKLL